MKAVGRNERCPCGSGKKYKHCCATLATAVAAQASTTQNVPAFSAEQHIELGLAARERGAHAEALRQFQAALAVKPRSAEAASQLGFTYALTGQQEHAKAYIRQAIAIKPDLAAAHSNLGFVFLREGALDEAIDCAGRALNLDGNCFEALGTLGDAWVKKGYPAQAVTYYRRALALRPNFFKGYSLLFFFLQFDTATTLSALQAEGKTYAALFEAPLKAEWRPHANRKDKQRRLKVGYVSPDFRNHPVGRFILPVLAGHDRTQIESYCYFHGVNRDPFTDELKKVSDFWLDCASMSDAQIAECIRIQDIDILIDLAGHTEDSRMMLFARKPAPIQITYLGYPGSSWLTAMDYRLTDRCADPAGNEEWHTERLLRLPDSFFCYRPQPGMPEVNPLPAATRGYITFGSFASFNRLDALTIALWADILKALPDARLMVLTVPPGNAGRELVERFSSLGIAAERLELHGRMPMEMFLQTMQKADIALDPVTVNSPTTICEALWLGLPTLSKAGKTPASRTGLSVLNAAGLRKWAVEENREYVEAAVSLASDIPALATIRQGLRSQLAHSALMNERQFVQALEDTYREVWAQWCEG